MNDMSAVIIPKSDQINADDLIGGPRTIRIAGVTVRPGTEQPVSIQIEGDAKVFRPCKSMDRVMVAAWGADSSQYVGRSLTLYRDPKVKWGGMEVGGIRISHMTDIQTAMTMALTETKQSRKPFTVKPLVAERIAEKPKPAAASTPASPAEYDPFWADTYESMIDTAVDFTALSSDLKTITSSPEYNAFKREDEARCTALRTKAQEKLTALKSAKNSPAGG